MLDTAEKPQSELVSAQAASSCLPELSASAPPALSLAKRILDLIGTVALLVLFGPILLIFGLVICLESPGPALYRQRRTGLNGKPFTIVKLRTMTVDHGDNHSPAAVNDARITRFGAFLRRTGFDELPQLLNVLKGEMSLVGPRPHALAHDEIYWWSVRDYELRFRTRPGITGLAQIRDLRGGGEIGEIDRRTRADNEYIENWSLWLDIKILIATAPHLIRFRAY